MINKKQPKKVLLKRGNKLDLKWAFISKLLPPLAKPVLRPGNIPLQYHQLKGNYMEEEEGGGGYQM